jgi:GTP cyclohydrolase I
MTAGPSLHIARDSTGVDIVAAERAAADFLAALGIDVEHEDLQETPARMARAYAELFSPAPLRLTTFANDEGYDELVLARSIPFRTVCEHHLLPFSGVAHVGYLPGERREDGDLGPAGHATGRPGQPGRVLRPGRRAALSDGAPGGCRRKGS